MEDFENKVQDIELSSSDFEFVHKEDFGKIHDEKFKTKPTTYFKDALKRFVKNKSSVVGAIIIAVLMLGSVFVPIISPYDTKQIQDSAFKLLPPKIFQPGGKSGFWDGTISMESYLQYDEETDTYYPAETETVKSNAVILDTMKIHDTIYYDHHAPNLYGGHIRVSSRRQADYNGTSNHFFFENHDYFKVSNTSNTSVKIVMSAIDNAKEGSKLGEFRVRLSSRKRAKDDDPNAYYLLQDWSTNYPTAENPLELNLSSALPADTSLDYCSVSIEGKPNAGYLSYFMVDEITFKCDDQEYYDNYLTHIEIDDANNTLLKTIDKLGAWVSNGELNAYQTKYSKVTFRYDVYEEQLGLKKDLMVGQTELNRYIEKGWCEYDWTVGPSSFKILDDACPIVTVHKQEMSDYEGIPTNQIYCDLILYKRLGYSSMPAFFLGTDDNGRALFTHALRCLKNSLAISILCCAVTIAMGLVWGSISGYYGGAIDLIMERISDILYAVPGTVVLTLVLLHMGKTLFTFAFAVCLTGWIGTASLTRTQMYRFKNRESVLASRTLGANDGRLIFKHILPNAMGTIVTSSVLKIPGFIFTEASLAFLHLGLDTGDSFGVLISNYQQFLSTRPVLIFFPSIILCLLMISFNLFGNGLRDALNPTLKGGEQ